MSDTIIFLVLHGFPILITGYTFSFYLRLNTSEETEFKKKAKEHCEAKGKSFHQYKNNFLLYTLICFGVSVLYYGGIFL